MLFILLTQSVRCGVSLAQNSVDSFKNELDAELLFTYALRSPLLHEMPSLLCFMPSRRDLTLG